MGLKIRRILASGVDYYIIVLCIVILSFIIDHGLFIDYIIVIFCILFKDLMFRNQSIGKKLFKLRISTTNDDTPNWVILILRNLTVIIWPIEIILILIYNRRIMDLILKTQVVES